MTPFLRATWTDLVIISYAVPDDWLLPFLPTGISLDRWEGSAYVSLWPSTSAMPVFLG